MKRAHQLLIGHAATPLAMGLRMSARKLCVSTWNILSMKGTPTYSSKITYKGTMNKVL